MARRKRWSKYTVPEINKVKEEKCSKCPFASRSSSFGTIICDYILIMGKSRNNYPQDCKYYLMDKRDVNKLKTLRDLEFARSAEHRKKVKKEEVKNGKRELSGVSDEVFD